MAFLRSVYTDYLFKQLQKQSDAVLNNTHLDKQFGIAFFDQLNALKKRL